MAEVPPRYLFAYLGRRESARRALLRFPPGVTLEDAGHDWRSSAPFPFDPTLSARAVERLQELGVEVVDVRESASGALGRARAENVTADLDAFAEDYLDTNTRLGGGRCVTMAEYAMHTRIGYETLLDALRDRLLGMDGVRVYGGAAFREGELPDVLHLRVANIALLEIYVPRGRAPGCLLHGACDMLNSYSHSWCSALCVADLPCRYRGVRVAMPRRLLDNLAAARAGRDLRLIARAAMPVVSRAYRALPEMAWREYSLSKRFAPMVAVTAAETCEEYIALVQALRGCGSLREMVRRARDASWVASRTLERLMDW